MGNQKPQDTDAERCDTRGFRNRDEIQWNTTVADEIQRIKAFGHLDEQF